MEKELIISKGISFMNVKGYHFPEGWIEACLQWLFEEHNHEFNTVSLGKWCDLIEQQWLFTDIRELEISSIISNFNNSPKSIFTGIICLQIMRFEDVSKSFYGQIQKMKCIGSEDTDVGNEIPKQTSKRSLQLYLTDGINSIRGFEFESWNQIRTDSISCGCKCQLQGPFPLQNGTALLKQRNIKILGGEVEDMKNTSMVTMLEEALQSNIAKLKTGMKPRSRPMALKNQKLKTEPKREVISQNSRHISTDIGPVRTIIKNQSQETVLKPLNPNQFERAFQSMSTALPVVTMDNNNRQSEVKISQNAPSSRSSTQETCIDFDDDDDDDCLRAFEEISEGKPYTSTSEERTNIVEAKARPNINLSDGRMNTIQLEDKKNMKLSEARTNPLISGVNMNQIQTEVRSNIKVPEGRTNQIKIESEEASNNKSSEGRINQIISEVRTNDIETGMRSNINLLEARTNQLKTEAEDRSKIKAPEVSYNPQNPFGRTFSIIPEEINEPQNTACFSDQEEFVCLFDIFKELENPDSNPIISKQYKVKAFIARFLTRLTTEKDSNSQFRWKLQLRINDGTSSLDCELSDGFMSSRIGFSANTFHEKKHTGIIDQLKSAIKGFQAWTARCNGGVFTLQLTESCDKIEIVNYAEMDQREVEELNIRVSRMS